MQLLSNEQLSEHLELKYGLISAYANIGTLIYWPTLCPRQAAQQFHFLHLIFFNHWDCSRPNGFNRGYFRYEWIRGGNDQALA